MLENFRFLQSQSNFSIQTSKQAYYSHMSKKLTDTCTSPKTYWSILNSFLNKKIPCIPLRFHEITFIKVTWGRTRDQGKAR